MIAVPVDFLLVTSLDGNAVVPSLMAASDAGIPILAVSNEPAEPGQALLVAYSGPDDYVQGVIAAELMHDALGGEGNVVIIEGTPGQSTTAARNKGFDDGLAQRNSNIKVLARQTANWNPVNAKAVTEDFITQFGDKIDGLFSQDDNTAASAAEVLVAAGMTDVKVVGTGGSINGVAAIRNGLVYGTMDQSPTHRRAAGARDRPRLSRRQEAGRAQDHHSDAEDHGRQCVRVQGRVGSRLKPRAPGARGSLHCGAGTTMTAGTFRTGMKVYDNDWFLRFDLDYDDAARLLADWGVTFILAQSRYLPMPGHGDQERGPGAPEGSLRRV